jgi:integrase
MVGLRRTATGLWAARKEIPQDVRAAYGKREEKRTWPAELTLGQARAELAAWLVPIEERVALLRAAARQTAVTLSQRQSRALAGEWYRAQVAEYEANPGSPEGWWLSREDFEPEEPEEREAGLIKPNAWLIGERDALLLRKALAVKPAAAEALLQDMGDLWLSLCSLMERRAAGDYGPDPLEATLPIFSEVAPRTAPVAVSITKLFAEYEGTGTASPATIKKWNGVIAKFVEFLGHDDAAAVTLPDVDRWVRALVAKPLSVKSVRDGYLAAVSVIMRDAVSRGLIPSNPTAGVQVRGPKSVALRSKSLSDSEAETILRAALGPHPQSLSPRYALARRWVPWVQAYTGARVNEISQLRAMDIREEQGVWIIHITPDAGPIKNGKARSVPLHPHLIEQGFHKLGRVGDPTPLFYDPSAHRGGKDGNPQSKKVGERLAQWVRSLGIEGVAPNHGWRHRFKTVARAVGMDPEARDAIQGHATRTEGQAYGDWPLEALRAEVTKLPVCKL